MIHLESGRAGHGGACLSARKDAGGEAGLGI